MLFDRHAGHIHRYVARSLGDDVVSQFGIDRGAAYDAVRRGELPMLRIGRKILVPTADRRPHSHTC